MNTRLQVEHPVTEMISGVDIVAEQLKVVSGERLEIPEDALCADGHAIEFRIYAGYMVPPHYDSLLAKLIVHARDREASIRRGLRALDEFAVSGMETTLPLHLAVL